MSPALADPGFEATPPSAWVCACSGEVVACTTGEGSTGRALVLGSHCAAFQAVSDVDPTRGLSLAVRSNDGGWARGFLAGWTADAVGVPDWHARNASRTVAAMQSDSGPAPVGRHGSTAPPGPAPGEWRPLATSTPLDTTGLAEVRVLLVNDTGAPVAFDEVTVEPAGPNPVGSLVHVVHRAAWAVSAGRPGSGPATLWVPLPMNVSAQVPLATSLAITPSVATVTFANDALGNQGVTLSFPEGVASSHVEVDWESLVLTRAVAGSERARFYPFDGDPQQWLAPSAIADAAFEGIAAAGAAIAGPEPTSVVRRLVEWTTRHGHYHKPRMLLRMPALDATTVFRGAPTSCTGFANLAAAVGRAAGLPTRVLAGILVGSPQQTHYINESWLGPEGGWLRFEPQGKASVPEDYVIALRRVLPSDEGPDALRRRRFAMGGVPLRTLSEPLAGEARFSWAASTEPFSSCAECDNQATGAAVLAGERERMDRLFERARAIRHVPPTDSTDVLEAALEITTMDQLERFVTAREAATSP